MTDSSPTLEEIMTTTAKIAYDAVAHYSHKELRQIPVKFFHELSEDKKQNITHIVNLIAKGEINTIAWLHEYWCQTMKDEGWSYASYYDEDNKLHHNLVMAAFLSPEERNKHFIFYYTVLGLLSYQDLFMNYPNEGPELEELQD